MKPEIEHKLIQFAAANAGKPFVWGRRCCNTLGLTALDIITGGNHAAIARGKFENMLQAELFQKRDGRRFSQYLQNAGAVEVQKGFEQTGDFLTLAGLHWDFVSIVIAGRALVADSEGCRMVDLYRVRYSRVWRVR